jgi:hypothetical protein
MVETLHRGPLGNMGSLELQAGTAATIEPMDGPSVSYQGWALADPAGLPFAKDGALPGRVPGYLHTTFWTVDNKPQATATNVVAAVQASLLTANASMALATVGVAGANAGNPSIAVAVPIIPLGTTTVTNVIALDFGFTTGTTTANSSTVNCADNTQLSLGQWIIIGNVGNSANTASLITQVQSIATANTTGVTVGPGVPLATLGNAPIGQANLFGSGLLPPATQFGPGAPAATAHAKVLQAGLLRLHNPRENVTRNISVSLTTGGTATAIGFLVTGYDWRGSLMTELITSPATTSATVTFGKKAFKYLQVVQQTIPTTGNTYSVGIGDTFGMPIRSDDWSQTEVYWNNAAMTNANGYSSAVTTSPATNTTGDVRGTVQVSTAGALATSLAAPLSTGTAKLGIIQDLAVWNLVAATPNNTAPFFGVANSTT